MDPSEFEAEPSGGQIGGHGSDERTQFDELVIEVSSLLLATTGQSLNSFDHALKSVAKYFNAEKAIIINQASAVAGEIHSYPRDRTDSPAGGAASGEPDPPDSLQQWIPDNTHQPETPGQFTRGVGFSTAGSGTRFGGVYHSDLQIAVPLSYTGQTLGSLRLLKNRFARGWSKEMTHQLKSLASLFSAALVRQRIDQSLRNYHERVEFTLRKELDRAEQHLQTVQVMMVALDLSGKVTLINRKGCEILGYEESELIGRKVIDLIIPIEERDLMWNAFRKVKSGDLTGADHFEGRLVTKSGEQRYFVTNNAVLRDDSGSVIGILCSAHDVTARKPSRSVMTAGEEQYLPMFELFQEVYYRTDLEGHILQLTPSDGRILGYSAEELIGKRARDLYDDDPAWRAAYLQKLLNSDEIFDFEHAMRARDGRLVDVSISAHRIVDSDGVPVGFEGVIRDISERKRSESILRSLVKGTASTTGRAFFRSLVQSVGEGLDCRHVHVGEITSDLKLVRTLSVWNGERFERNFEYSLNLSRCFPVSGQKTHVEVAPKGETLDAQQCFGVAGMATLLKAPLVGVGGELIGCMVIMSAKLMTDREVNEAASLLIIAAARAAAELQRMHTERELRRTCEELRLAGERLKTEQGALKEHNIALKLVLDHIEQDKEAFRQEARSDLRHLLSPFIKKLREGKGRLSEKELATLESLDESVLGRGADTFRSNFSKLSPREAEICELIAEGHPSKDISAILGISIETIHKHREIIRRKLGIQNLDLNLSTYLRSRLK